MKEYQAYHLPNLEVPESSHVYSAAFFLENKNDPDLIFFFPNTVNSCQINAELQISELANTNPQNARPDSAQEVFELII
ncbi:hypothetical protein JCM37173_33300 [Allocoprococcus similis]